MSRAYYNENDPFAAEWLRILIREEHIAPGDIDERSIEDVRPDDLAGYTQCHFFAGIGGWSYALRQAGWSDDKPVWTGSCPCQPFSAAGKGKGFADERHLWPAWYHLIQQCRPGVVFGEQVASKDGLGWLDLVQADLEAAGYASGAVDMCAAGVGAPHIRQRLWFVAEWVGDAKRARLEGHAGNGDRGNEPGRQQTHENRPATEASSDGRMANTDSGQCRGRAETTGRDECDRKNSRRAKGDGGAAGSGGNGGMADPNEQQRNGCRDAGTTGRGESANGGAASGLADTESEWINRKQGIGSQQREQAEQKRTKFNGDSEAVHPGPLNGFWRSADWLLCRDGRWRPVEPGTFPLATGVSNRVGRLRGYGNAINAEAAKEFIKASMEILGQAA